MTLKIQTAQTDCSPEEVQFDPQKLEALDTHFQSLIEQERIQGAGYLLARKGKIFAHRSVGNLLFDDPEKPLLPDSIRGLASMTKPVTATAIMQLVEKGRLYLEQPVADFIKEFNTDAHREIQIFHLLTHTSGLPADGGYWLEPYPVRLFGIKDKQELIKSWLAGPSHFKPGECWAYASIGYVVLGEIIAEISGLTYEEYVEKNILAPLGMKDTHFILSDEKKRRVCLTNDEERKELMDPKISTTFNAGGGLLSTTQDIWRFTQMFLNKGTFNGQRILGRITVEKMTANQLKNVKANAWGEKFDDRQQGLGWIFAYRGIVTPGSYQHEGAGRCIMMIDPVEELIAIMLVPSILDWEPRSILAPLNIIWSGLE